MHCIAGAKLSASSVGADAHKKEKHLLNLDFDLISTRSVQYSATPTDFVAQQ